ncbi:MAG TPA: aminomethyl-transferring glycine dehydrogenase subunit GcvPA [Haliangiales bacterium]|nr:aminomethyl-transferring glycine dehydrogenase subunit GcvPA [Haliangiales bacterium]
MRYIPHTPADVERMLRSIGAPSLEALWKELIPDALRRKGPLDLPPPLDEPTLRAHLHELAGRNAAARPYAAGAGPLAFLGAGVHPHTIPAAVDMLLQRSEFYTSYTPYQPEVSQGTLQAIFEFQTIVAELTGLEVANASMYDGATACAEAVLMARRVTGRDRTLFLGGKHPEYLEVCRTVLSALPGSVDVVPRNPRTGATDPAEVDKTMGPDVACVVVQNPTFYGVVLDVAPFVEVAHRHGAMCVVVTTDPAFYAVGRSPGEAGADIAVGEGIGLALGASLGGPGLGLFACRAAHVRQMPGRLCGETVDKDGRRGFVLTLSTREQHIRREKATSNICTNTGLVALAFAIHLSLLGKTGLRELARLVYGKTMYLRGELVKAGFTLAYPDAPIFNEVCLRTSEDAQKLVDRALARGVIPGVPLGRFDAAESDLLLVGVSELHRKEDLDQLVATLKDVRP